MLVSAVASAAVAASLALALATGVPSAGAAPLHEADVNLDIANRVADILRSRGIDVALTRTSDVSVGLVERARAADDADFLISVHNNGSTNRSARGTEVYAQVANDVSAELAQRILDGVVAHAGTPARGVIRRMGEHGDYYSVLRNSRVPAVIVEGAFVSNPSDAALLADPGFRQQVAEGIAEGVLAQFGDLAAEAPSAAAVGSATPAQSLPLLGLPGGLTANRISADAVRLTWLAVPLSSGYEVWRDGALLGFTLSPIFDDNGIRAAGSGRHRYEVRAVLAVGALRLGESPLAAVEIASGGRVVLDPGHGGDDPGAVGSH